jgi:uncharacterized membrane protein
VLGYRMEEDPEIDLQRFKRHKKQIPWSLIRKFVIAIILSVVLYFMYTAVPEEKPKPFEIEIEFPD